MKKLLLLICASAMSLASVSAQTLRRSVEASDIRMTRSGEYVTVLFTLDAGRKVTKASENLVVNPILRDGASERALPSVIIRGRRSKVLDQRHELATGERIYEQEPLYVTAGESADYAATVPYESWMRGSELVFEGVRVGCCSSTEVEFGLIAENVLYAEPVFETKVVEVPLPMPTTGGKLAERYSFVAPMSELAQRGTNDGSDRGTSAPRNNDEQRFMDETREGSISIYFKQGLYSIDRDYMDNNTKLVELISVVRDLSTAKDSRISKIVIAGFTSPEGGTALNERLAWNRATVVREFLLSNTNVDPGVITVYNGGVDWAGLRALVAESDIYNRQRIMDIIDYSPVWDARNNVGRLGELMRLDGGDPYRYMFRNLFPKLRQAAYIKVYYEDSNK